MSHTARLLTLTVAVCMLVSPSLVSCECKGPKACTEEYNPICGTFKKAFSNPCELQAAICNLAQQGFQYVQYTEGDCCDFACLTVFDPVTGCDNKTYSNDCVMKYTACHEKRCIYSIENSGPPLE